MDLVLRRAKRQEREIANFAARIIGDYPNCSEADEIARHACKIGSGKVGRSRVAEDPVRAAVVAHIRHKHTDYDERMSDEATGDFESRQETRMAIREEIRSQIDEVLESWSKEELVATMSNGS